MILAESVETRGVDLRTKVKMLGAKEEVRRRTCRVRFSLIKKKGGLSEELLEERCEEAVDDGNGVSESMESTCSGNDAHREIFLKEADGGSSSREEGVDLALHLLGSLWS